MKVKALIETTEIYKMSSIGTVFGCLVKWGRIDVGDPICVMNGSKKVFPLDKDYHYVEHIKRYKQDVLSVVSGDECVLPLGELKDLSDSFTVLVFEHQKEEEVAVGSMYRKASSN